MSCNCVYNPCMILHYVRTILALSLLLTLLACATKGPNFATGTIAGQTISENMDSEIAKVALSSEHNEYNDPNIDRLLSTLDSSTPPTPQQLQILVKNGSTDFASIIYARKLLNDRTNSFWQNHSLEVSQRIHSPTTKEKIKTHFSKHHALLIPGWNWETRHDTGADLDFQKKALASFGLTSSLVRTDEHGSVEKNAKIIVQAIDQAKSLNKSIILISVSKGGADSAYALGKLIDIENTPHLVGWLNIGGIISGSTLVDLEMNDPEKWLLSIGFAADTPLTAVQSLRKDIAIKRAAELSFPKQVRIVNYAALPFADNLSKQSHYSYSRLAQYGPNDGAALTYEMLVDNQPTVLEIGLDHFMRSLRAMNRAIALLYMIAENK